MSSVFKPKVYKPKEAKAKPLTQVQDRGRVGRTIIAGRKDQGEVKTQKKTILGG